MNHVAKYICGSLGLAALTAHPALAQERPNIVLFLVDDMGLMDTSVPFDVDADGNPVRRPLNDWYRTPWHGTPCAAGHPFHHVLRPKRQLALARLADDRAECRTSSHHKLD